MKMNLVALHIMKYCYVSIDVKPDKKVKSQIRNHFFNLFIQK